MFHIEDVLQLKDGEDVRLLVRRHAITMIPRLFIALALIVVPFFLLFPLFSWGIAGMAAFVISVLAGIVTAMRTFLMWDADVLVITTLRLVDVDQKGVFSRFVTEAPFSLIQDASWHRKGVVDTVFKIGTLKIQTAGTSTAINVRRVARPELVHELINDLRHATTPKRIDLSPEIRERIRKISMILENLTPESLNRIETAIRDEGRDTAVSNFLTDENSSA